MQQPTEKSLKVKKVKSIREAVSGDCTLTKHLTWEGSSFGSYQRLLPETIIIGQDLDIVEILRSNNSLS